MLDRAGNLHPAKTLTTIGRVRLRSFGNAPGPRERSGAKRRLDAGPLPGRYLSGRHGEHPGPRPALIQFLEIKMTKDQAKAARHLREANNAFKAVPAEKPMTDYAKDQQSRHDNHERLKAARLAREAEPKDDQA